MSTRRGGGPRRGFLRPRRTEERRAPAPDVSHPVVRRVPTLDENIERAVKDAGKAVGVTLDALYDAAEMGFVKMTDEVIDLFETKPEVKKKAPKQRARPRTRPSAGFLTEMVRYVGTYMPLVVAAEIAVFAGLTLPVGVSMARRALEAMRTEEERKEYEAMIEKRINDAHERAGKQLRARKDLRNEFTPEQIDAVADGLEAYDAGKVFDVFARHGGIPSWDVAAYSRVTEVRTYSEKTLKDFLDNEERQGVMTKEQIDELREEAQFYGGYYYKTVIYLNVTSMVGKERDPKEVYARTRDVLHHENAHGFWGYWASNTKDDDGLDRFNEGTTELFSNVVTRELSVAKKDPYTGYIGGETASAAVVYESMPARGRRVMWSSYVHGEVMKLNDVYNAQFGKNAFGDVLYHDDLHFGPNAPEWIARSGITNYDEKNVREHYREVASLDRALQNAGDDWADVTQHANRHLGTGLIVPIRGENLNGVLVVSTYSNNELTGGLVRLDGTKGRRIALLNGHDNAGLIVLPGTNVAYLRVDLDAYSLSRKDLEEQTFEERGAAAVKMLRQHRSALLHFREM